MKHELNLNEQERMAKNEEQNQKQIYRETLNN